MLVALCVLLFLWPSLQCPSLEPYRVPSSLQSNPIFEINESIIIEEECDVLLNSTIRCTDTSHLIRCTTKAREALYCFSIPPNNPSLTGSEFAYVHIEGCTLTRGIIGFHVLGNVFVSINSCTFDGSYDPITQRQLQLVSMLGVNVTNSVFTNTIGAGTIGGGGCAIILNTSSLGVNISDTHFKNCTSTMSAGCLMLSGRSHLTESFPDYHNSQAILTRVTMTACKSSGSASLGTSGGALTVSNLELFNADELTVRHASALGDGGCISLLFSNIVTLRNIYAENCTSYQSDGVMEIGDTNVASLLNITFVDGKSSLGSGCLGLDLVTHSTVDSVNLMRCTGRIGCFRATTVYNLSINDLYASNCEANDVVLYFYANRTGHYALNRVTLLNSHSTWGVNVHDLTYFSISSFETDFADFNSDNVSEIVLRDVNTGGHVLLSRSIAINLTNVTVSSQYMALQADHIRCFGVRMTHSIPPSNIESFRVTNALDLNLSNIIIENVLTSSVRSAATALGIYAVRDVNIDSLVLRNVGKSIHARPNTAGDIFTFGNTDSASMFCRMTNIVLYQSRIGNDRKGYLSKALFSVALNDSPAFVNEKSLWPDITLTKSRIPVTNAPPSKRVTNRGVSSGRQTTQVLDSVASVVAGVSAAVGGNPLTYGQVRNIMNVRAICRVINDAGGESDEEERWTRWGMGVDSNLPSGVLESATNLVIEGTLAGFCVVAMLLLRTFHSERNYLFRVLNQIWLFYLPSTITHGLRLLLHPSAGTGWKVCGALSASVHIPLVWMFYVWVLQRVPHSTTFLENTVRIDVYGGPKHVPQYLWKGIYWLQRSSSKWKNADPHSGFCLRYGLIFRTYRKVRKWFYGVEIAYTLAICMLVSSVRGGDACEHVTFGVMVVVCSFAISLHLLWPHHTLLESVVSWISQDAMTVMVLLTLLDVLEQSNVSLETTYHITVFIFLGSTTIKALMVLCSRIVKLREWYVDKFEGTLHSTSKLSFELI